MGSCCSTKGVNPITIVRRKASVSDHAMYLATLFNTTIHDEVENAKFGFQARLARDMLQSEPRCIKVLLDVFDRFILEVSCTLVKTKVIFT
jgi:hypothetical protein